ncbi:MAG: hypothetical protein QY318_00430 [Candidatus Dojkabacteria bacterium]|nr:MAG: hypothetical protein QY318_00430 [Candidatus Dojkabacteria bacterium]
MINSEEAETEPEVVERVVEVEKEMDWYTYEDASIFGGITFRYPEVFQVRTDFDGDTLIGIWKSLQI